MESTAWRPAKQKRFLGEFMGFSFSYVMGVYGPRGLGIWFCSSGYARYSVLVDVKGSEQLE